MTLTKHGHHVPGTTIEDEGKRSAPVARCGGPAICSTCKQDSKTIFERRPKF